MTETIAGKCPSCRKNTTFRELSFSELTSGLFSFFGNAVTSGIKGKVGAAGTLIESFTEDRKFPNYKCISCSKEVMQCSQCKEIIPYAHTGAEHFCGVTEAEPKKPGTTTKVRAAEDPISLLERLASLHKNGFLTDQEFEAKKAEILSRI